MRPDDNVPPWNWASGTLAALVVAFLVMVAVGLGAVIWTGFEMDRTFVDRCMRDGGMTQSQCDWIKENTRQ
jgi:hypothetical protein